ncbi:hypothetical protein [Methylocystis sp. S23]
MAPQNMNLGQARVIDPILTTQVRGYTNAQYIFPALFPYANIPVRGMRIIRFDQRAFRVESGTRRAPGTPTPALTFGFESDPVALYQDALDAVVPREIQEEAAAVPGIDMGARAVQLVTDKIDLGHEVACAALAMTPANYSVGQKTGLTGTDKFSDPASDPLQIVGDLKTKLAKRIGRQPNTMVFALDVLRALTRNSKIKDQFKYTSGESITVDMIARYLQIEKIVVGEAIYLPEGAADGAGQFVWGGGSVWLGYVDRGGSYQVPSYAYTYRLNGYPIVEQPYWDRSRKSWIYGLTQERAPVVAMPDAAELIYNVL